MGKAAGLESRVSACVKAVQIPALEQRGERISAEMQTNGRGLTWISALSFCFTVAFLGQLR